MLYGRKCHALICWDQVRERVIEGPKMIEVTNEKVAIAKEKLKEARTRQKSYADKHRRSIEFQPGDRVLLKVSRTRGVRRFGIKGKLSPRFIRPFKILDRVGEVSYRLALPPQLSHVHNIFHVSLLRGYKYHPFHVISYPPNQIRADLSYVKEPEAILDRQDRVMRNKTIPFVKILWRNHPEWEATWEIEELKFSTAFHPQTYGQTERTIQTLEDMLCSCALEWTGNWDDYICLVEFAYNNSWHASIKCAPFEMLYGRKCRAPIYLDQVGEHVIEGPEMIEVTNEKVAIAKEKLKEACTRTDFRPPSMDIPSFMIQ
nr:putative nucleotidyltransferase, ribonuclease H [Tanacetum cinerariifolium]